MTAPWEEKGPSAPRVEHKNYTDEPGNKYAKNPLILFYMVEIKKYRLDEVNRRKYVAKNGFPHLFKGYAK